MKYSALSAHWSESLVGLTDGLEYKPNPTLKSTEPLAHVRDTTETCICCTFLQRGRLEDGDHEHTIFSPLFEFIDWVRGQLNC